jgi:hypothetical protein
MVFSSPQTLNIDKPPCLFRVLTHFCLSVFSKVEQKNDDGLCNSSQMKFKNINCARNNLSMEMHACSAQENSDSEFKTTVSQVTLATIWNIMLLFNLN